MASISVGDIDLRKEKHMIKGILQPHMLYMQSSRLQNKSMNPLLQQI